MESRLVSHLNLLSTLASYRFTGSSALAGLAELPAAANLRSACKKAAGRRPGRSRFAALATRWWPDRPGGGPSPHPAWSGSGWRRLSSPLVAAIPRRAHPEPPLAGARPPAGPRREPARPPAPPFPPGMARLAVPPRLRTLPVAHLERLMLDVRTSWLPPVPG